MLYICPTPACVEALKLHRERLEAMASFTPNLPLKSVQEYTRLALDRAVSGVLKAPDAQTKQDLLMAISLLLQAVHQLNTENRKAA